MSTKTLSVSQTASGEFDALCQSSSAFHTLESIDGSSLFLVSKSNVLAWKEEIRINVDLKTLDVQLIVAHNDNANDDFRYTARIANLIRTVRESSFDLPEKQILSKH